MKPILASNDYTDPLVYQRELKKLFLPSWLFVGYTFDLRGENAWFAFELFGKFYFVQRDGEDLRCFANSCSHRHSQLRTDACGDGPIICPYHGWMYRNDGSVNAIPRKPRFCDVAAKDMDDLRLHSLNVATWGSLIFVQLDPAGVSWDDFISPVKSRLSPLIDSIGPFRRRIQRKVSANWKAVIENSAEAYHVDCVHPDTFGQLNLGTATFEYFGAHCCLNLPVGEAALKRSERVNRLLQSRHHHTRHYEHAIVFPNLGFSSIFGFNAIFEQFLPLSAEETLYTLDFFGCDAGPLTEETGNLVNAFFENSFAFTEALNAEDTKIVQIQHKGMVSSHRTGKLSEDEEMILFLQKQWSTKGVDPH